MVAHLRLQLGVVAGGVRRDQALRRHRLAAVADADQLVDVGGQRDGAPQRDLVRRVAADDGVFHVEVDVGAVGVGLARHAQATLDQVGRQLAVGRCLVDVFARHRAGLGHGGVDLGIEEGQPVGLRFFDDGDAHFVHQRQLAALQAREHGLAFGIVGGGLGVPALVAVPGVALQHDQRAATPLLQLEGPRADRVLCDLVAIELNHLARLRAVGFGRCQQQVKTRARLTQLELHGVAVERLQALDGRIEVEWPFCIERGFAHFGQTDEAGAGVDHAPVRALVGRVGDALEGIQEVLRRDLAPLTLERRVTLKVDARAHAHGPGFEVGRRLGHGRGQARLDLGRTRQVVVGVEGLEDVAVDGQRVDVVDLGRVEAGLGGAEGELEHLGRRVVGRERRARHQRGCQQGAGPAHHEAGFFVASMSTMCHHSCQNSGRR